MAKMTTGSFAVLGGLAIVLPLSSTTFAQSGDGYALEEVVVTARKREENLQGTPVAISAFTAEDFELRQIESTDRLGEVAPNVTFDSVSPSSGSSSAAQIFIRGIGQTDFTPVTDPGVGLYVDGVYMARSVGNVLDFLDVERVEILRGPQGTLFGRNTIGGAVVVHSKRPSEDFSASLEGQIGSDEMMFWTGKLNGAITSSLSGNLAYAYRHRDGYVRRLYDGIDLGDDNSNAFRGSLLWQPTERLTAYAALDYSAIRENGAPAVSGGINDRQAFGTFGNAALSSCTAITVNSNFPASGPPTFPPPGVGAGGAAGCYGPNTAAGPYVSEGTFPVRSDLDVWGISAELTWDLTDALEVKSITGYREMEMQSSRDGDNTPANIFATQDYFDHAQVSQELQLSGHSMNATLKWLFGVYYFQEDGFDINPVTLPVGAIQSGGHYDNDSHAAFLQTTYEATERLALTLGLRYTKDTKRFTPDQFAFGDASQGVGSIFGPTWPLLRERYLASTGAMLPGERLLPFQEFKREFDDTSLTANVAYRWTEDVMTYVTYSEGYKSGGFDQRYAAPPVDEVTRVRTNVPSTFEPETVESYELGLKSQWLNNRLRLNLALFHTDYNDLQIIIRQTFNTLTFNGGAAEIDGAEAELTWVPTDRWLVTSAVGYMDAKYKSLSREVLTNASPIAPANDLVNTPDLNVSLGAAYTFDMAALGTLTPRIDWSYHGSQYNDAVNTPQLQQDAYNMLNAAIVFKPTDGRWQGILAFRNILDEEYLLTGQSAFATSGAYVEQIYGRPFEWSLSIRYTF